MSLLRLEDYRSPGPAEVTSSTVHHYRLRGGRKRVYGCPTKTLTGPPKEVGSSEKTVSDLNLEGTRQEQHRDSVLETFLRNFYLGGQLCHVRPLPPVHKWKGFSVNRGCRRSPSLAQFRPNRPPQDSTTLVKCIVGLLTHPCNEITLLSPPVDSSH